MNAELEAKLAEQKATIESLNRKLTETQQKLHQSRQFEGDLISMEKKLIAQAETIEALNLRVAGLVDALTLQTKTVERCWVGWRSESDTQWLSEQKKLSQVEIVERIFEERVNSSNFEDFGYYLHQILSELRNQPQKPTGERE